MSSPKKKKKQAPASDSKTVLIVVGALCALLLLGLIGNALSRSGDREAASGALRVTGYGLDGAGLKNGAADWVTLENAASEPVELGGHALFLLSDVKKMYQFPRGTLQPGESVTLLADGAELPFKLPQAGGDALMLIDAQGGQIDSVEFGELPPYAVGERREDGSFSIASPDDDSEASPEAARVELVPDAVSFNELMSGNTLYGELCDYVELYNGSSSPVDLTGWSLSDEALKLRKWSFPDGTRIPAGGVLLIWCTGDAGEGLHAGIGLSREGETLYLTRADGACAASVTYPVLEKDQAYSFFEGEWSTRLAPTPGMENSVESAMAVNRALFGGAPLRVSEVYAAALNDERDWIEISNATASTIDLSGFGLSNDASKPRKWCFPQGTTIPAGGCIGVFCIGSDSYKGSQLAADFKLGDEGGYTVSIADAAGKVLDAIYMPEQYNGMSYGRDAGGDGPFYFETPTPAAANSGRHATARAKQPSFSVTGGCFTSGQSFAVELTAESGSRIYYTLDCSDVDESSTPYTGPIPVSGTTIIRARAYRDGCVSSLMDAQSYLFDIDNPDGVYIVSLVTDEKNLYSPELGLFYKSPDSQYDRDPVNNYMQDLEREGHMELYKGGTEQALSQECGLKLQGNVSRIYDPKAFKMVARAAYGNDRFSYPVFSKRDYRDYQSLVLRLSGQDYSRAFLRDSTLTQLARGTSVMYMENEVSVVYLNGQYYCLMYLRERINPISICRHEGWEGMEGDIDLVFSNKTVLQGSNESFEEILEYIRTHDMSTDEAYAFLDQRIDLQNYVEWMSIEMFVGNGDMLNSRRYRNPKTDGKWRWCLFDLDRGFLMDTDSMKRWLNPEGMGANKDFDTTLFIGCMKNPTFRDRLLTYLGDKMATEWTGEKMAARIDEGLARVKNYMGTYLKMIGVSTTQYQENFKELRDFALTRPYKFMGRSVKALGLSDEETEKYFGEALKVNPKA